MKTRITMSVYAVIAAVCSADAGTVAWYHFDEAAPGTHTTGESVIVNSVDPDVGPGIVRTWKKNGYNAPSIGTLEEYMPVYTNAFEDYVHVFDPDSYGFCASKGALHIRSADSASAFSTCSFLSISDHENFHSQSFTIEFFLKLPAHSHTTHRFILEKTFPYEKFSTTLPGMFRIVLSETHLQASFRPSAEAASVFIANGTTVADGNWHHVALVVNGTKKTVSLYVDGITLHWGPTDSVKNYEGELDFTGNTPIAFGPSSDNYYGSYEGTIAEVRISDEALSPESFLSFAIRAPVSELTGPETLFHTSFSDSMETRTTELKYGGSYLSYLPALLNDAPVCADYKVSTMYVASRKTYDPESYGVVSDVPHKWLAKDSVVPQMVGNGSSYSTGLTETNGLPTALLIKDGYAMLSDSFTIEFFGKMAEGEPSSEETRYAYLLNHNELLSFWCNNNGKLSLCLSNERKLLFNGSNQSPKTYNDGEWHHYAIVYDKTASTLELYVDYMRIGVLEDASFDTAQANKGASSDLVIFGYYANYVYGPRDYIMDELRITRGALSPVRFLRKGWKSLRMTVR